MLIMEDFSGRKTRQDRTAQRSPANRRPIRVDRDNVQDMLGKLDVALHSPLLGDSAPPVSLRFAELDDCHPDRLVHQVEPMWKLSDLRRRLPHPTTFPEAADEIRAWTQPRQPTEAQSVTAESLPHQAGVSGSPTSSLLDQLLEEASGSTPALRPTQWQSFLQSIVSADVVPKKHPMAQKLSAQVDAA
jgi:hypothetical protein